MTHTINVPLAEGVLGQILAAPERWTQDDWLSRPYAVDEQAPTDTVENCQTSGCFAGWTVVLGGYKTNMRDGVQDIPQRILAIWDEGWERADDAGLRPIGVPVRDVAAAELGLTSAQAFELFGAENSLLRLYQLLEEWTDGEIAVPADLPEWAGMSPTQKAHYFDQLQTDAEDVVFDEDDEDGSTG